jgi:molybdate transport system regulatory protein
MKISARNQLIGHVDLIQQGKVNAEVYIKLKSGYTMVAVITNEAVRELNLMCGDEVVAFFKSSCVLVTTDITLNISARNKFQGVITNMKIGEVNAVLHINIGNDEMITSVITLNSIRSLNIKLGIGVSAIIKASDVMIGKEIKG